MFELLMRLTRYRLGDPESRESGVIALVLHERTRWLRNPTIAKQLSSGRADMRRPATFGIAGLSNDDRALDRQRRQANQ